MSEQTQLLFESKVFSVVRYQAQRPDGSVMVRDAVRHPGAVTIVPVLPQDRVVLIRNHRIVVHETLIELPAGTLEPPESPQETARRELAEETGYRAESLVKLHEFAVSPGILTERMHLYLATQLTPSPPHREPGEEIENLVVSWQEAMTMVDDGRIHDAKTLVGLLYYDRIRNRGGNGGRSTNDKHSSC